MSTPTSLPDAKTITEASELKISDKKGEHVTFGSIFEKQKTVIVFIRHFFCGNCQEYVKQLATVSQSSLEAAQTKIIIIGCGEWDAIGTYSDMTGFKGPIYADPSRKLFQTLGLTAKKITRTPAGQQRRSYLTLGPLANTLLSILKGPMLHPLLIGKFGNINQLGGEFIFGPDKECSFASRMQHTEDHIEVADLMRAAGVTYP